MLKETLTLINEKIRIYKEAYSEILNQKEEDLKQLLEIASKLDDSWSQSWFGVYSAFYFDNFEKPSFYHKFDVNSVHSQRIIPSDWEEQSYESIASYIESKSNGLSITHIENEIKTLIDQIKQIQDLLVTELVIIEDNARFHNEWELIEKAKNHKWGLSVTELNSINRPKDFVVSSVIFQLGIKVPPHIVYKNQVSAELSKIQSIEEFLRTAKKINRQIELKMETNGPQNQKNHLDKIMNIFSKFSVVSRQLRNRHNNRSTIEIDDEYDVQDLLHALLKLYFDDVRSEEWTPSYAGGSSRMDFLLKNERIVIEVKKTRKSLGDKEVGEQLIVDIAKYKQHSDCKTLICFVYDPENRIGNPLGLENDLDQMCTEEMNVMTIIEPK